MKAFERVGVSKRKLIVADNARPEMIRDISSAGYMIEPCVKYKGSVVDGISKVSEYGLKIVTGSKNLFDEIKNYVWKLKNGKAVDEPDVGVDHLMDAVRYGVVRLSVPAPSVAGIGLMMGTVKSRG